MITKKFRIGNHIKKWDKSLKNILIFILFCNITMLYNSTPINIDGSSSDIINNPSNSAIMMEIYVSPDGNDSKLGTEAEPFKTIFKAQEEVRAVSGSMTGDIIVHLMEGTHFINETLKFNESDSGTNGNNIIYQAFEEDITSVSGGVSVTDWTEGEDGIWSASSPVSDYRQLYINSERKVRARGEPTMISDTDGDGHKLSNDSIKEWGNLQDVEFVYKYIWTLPRVRPLFVKNDFIYMQQPGYSFTRYKSDSQNEAPEWIENAYELLDEPGEWYLNKATDKVYYMPESNENMMTADVIVPELELLLNITGIKGQPVSNLQFKNLSFQYGSWLLPNQFGTCLVPVQANVIRIFEEGRWSSEKSPGNIICKYTNNILFNSCNFTHLGTTGLDLQKGVQNSSIIGCKFSDISGIGIQIGEISGVPSDPNDLDVVRNVNILNNYITNCSVEYMSGPGIFTGYIRNVRMEHNSISNLPYTGISCGWGWNAAETICANNSIKFNHIYGIMNYLTDGGGIYTLSTQPGTNVSYNYIHDSGWNGLYPDERTNQTVWSYNVVEKCDNSFLDHSMYEKGHWNDVFMNFLDSYPKHLWVWYNERDEDQIWGPSYTGYEALRQQIINNSGVQLEYKYLIPENEYYWKYKINIGTLNFLSNKVIFWITTSIIMGIFIYGVIFIIKAPETRESTEGFSKTIKNKENNISTGEEVLK